MCKMYLFWQNFPKKAKEGKLEETNHCVCCLQGCFGEADEGQLHLFSKS